MDNAQAWDLSDVLTDAERSQLAAFVATVLCDCDARNDDHIERMRNATAHASEVLQDGGALMEAVAARGDDLMTVVMATIGEVIVSHREGMAWDAMARGLFSTIVAVYLWGQQDEQLRPYRDAGVV